MEAKVFYLKREKIFSYSEAQNLLTIVMRMTDQASQQVQKLIDQMDQINQTSAGDLSAHEEKINKIIEGWQNKILKIGAVPKGIWIVDFDFGQGYFCWKHSETKLEFWHSEPAHSHLAGRAIFCLLLIQI